MDAIEQALRGSEPRVFTDAAAFWDWHRIASGSRERPIDRAIAGGAATAYVGFAFTAGYGAALQALVPGLGKGSLASLAATESAGAHPAGIETTLSPAGEDYLLTGHKRWVTLAGPELLVFARTGVVEDGKHRTVLVRLQRERAGVQVTPLPDLPFMPEVAHAEIRFDAVRIRPEELLPGDGWQDWVKPFRTVEDVHVHAALLGMLLSLGARIGWPQPLRERMASTLVALRSLALEPASSPSVHLALAGAIQQVRAIVEELEPHWSLAPADVRERWRRDRPLLEVASKARSARTARAWERLAGSRSS